LPSVNYGDGRDPFASFDLDQWELYHVAEDLSETIDLATERPEKLREMVARWWEDAERFNVLPLNNQPGRHGDRRYRHDRYVYHPGIGSLPETVAPNLRNRGFHIVAELEVPADGGVQGVIVCHGGPAGGYAFYAKDNRIHFVHNLLGAEMTTVSATVPLPPGPVNARAVFTPTGRFKGDIALYYDDVPVGEGNLARTTPISYGVEGFTVGYQRGAAVTPAYDAPFAIDHSVLHRVVIDGIGPPHRDQVAEERVAMAQQ
jgi:arylsulfatase